MDSSVNAASLNSKSQVKPRPKVLAVDDQADSLKLLQLRLRAAGMEGIPFSNGAAALEFLREQLVDVIILDIMMPEPDGLEICRRLKEDPRTRDIPVLFLTAKMEPADKVKGLDAGGHDYLNKPVEQEELIARTRAALRVKRLQDELRGELKLKERIHELHQGMLDQYWENTFGQLAASLAHEINNPLAAALGNIQLLIMDEELDGSVRDRLAVVDQSLQRAGQKLRSLLLVAHSHQQRQQVSLNGLVEDILTMVNYRLVLQKAAVEKFLEPDCRWHGLISEFARAILYVLNNAIEAVQGRSQPKIKVQVEKDGEYDKVRIIDNGPGVEDASRFKVFEAFFTTKPRHTGLGLYLASRIMREAGGDIEWRKLPQGPGVEFCLSAPRNPEKSSSEYSQSD